MDIYSEDLHWFQNVTSCSVIYFPNCLLNVLRAVDVKIKYLLQLCFSQNPLNFFFEVGRGKCMISLMFCGKRFKWNAPIKHLRVVFWSTSTVQSRNVNSKSYKAQLMNINLRPVLPPERSSDTDSKTRNVSDGSVHKASWGSFWTGPPHLGSCQRSGEQKNKEESRRGNRTGVLQTEPSCPGHGAALPYRLCGQAGRVLGKLVCGWTAETLRLAYTTVGEKTKKPTFCEIFKDTLAVWVWATHEAKHHDKVIFDLKPMGERTYLKRSWEMKILWNEFYLGLFIIDRAFLWNIKVPMW